jgi:DNA-binding transcriptional LysR family regulator
LNGGNGRFADDIYRARVPRGSTRKISQQVREASSLVCLVAAGFGLASIPELVSRLAHPDVIRPINPPFLSADVYALHHRRKSPVADKLLDLVCDEATALSEHFRKDRSIVTGRPRSKRRT